MEKRKYIVTLERVTTDIVNIVVLASSEHDACDAAAEFAKKNPLPRQPITEVEEYKPWGAARYVGDLLDVEV